MLSLNPASREPAARQNRALGACSIPHPVPIWGCICPLFPCLSSWATFPSPATPPGAFCTPSYTDMPVRVYFCLLQQTNSAKIWTFKLSRIQGEISENKSWVVVHLFPSIRTKEDKLVVQGLCEILTMHYCSLQSPIQQGTPIKLAVWKGEAPLAPEQQLTRVRYIPPRGQESRCAASFIFIIP